MSGDFCADRQTDKHTDRRTEPIALLLVAHARAE